MAYDLIRVGIVPYLNMLPLVHGMDRLRLPENPAARLEIVSNPPSIMAAMMDRGEIDLGMVPTGALIERPNWTVVGNSMIGSDGPVKSVLALGAGPPESWNTLHPDSHSRTSNLLVRILLANLHGATPALGSPIPLDHWEPPPRLNPGEAFVLIGTRALRWRTHSPAGATVLDLGELWTRWTGLPFVYAVWAAREGLDRDQARIHSWMREFEALKSRNLERLPEILNGFGPLANENLSRDEALDYLTTNIIFDLDDRARAGLDRFRAEAQTLS